MRRSLMHSAKHIVFRHVLVLVAVTACSETSAPDDSGNTPVVPGVPSLGANASLNGKRPFPADNPWNQGISNEPVDPNSDALIASCGIRNLHPDFGTTYNGVPNGIPYVVIAGGQARVNVTFTYADESDIGPYPIPRDAPIEGGVNGAGDRHIIIIDRDNWR